jgi:hypothetical protein
MTFFIRRIYYNELAYFALNFDTRRLFELEFKRYEANYPGTLEVQKRCFIKMFGKKFRIGYPYTHPKTITAHQYIGFTAGGDLSGNF